MGVSYEKFLPLIKLLKDRFHIIGAQVDGFTLDQNTEFTSIDDQARQVSMYIKENLGGDRACDIGKDSGDGSYECRKVYPFGCSKAFQEVTFTIGMEQWKLLLPNLRPGI